MTADEVKSLQIGDQIQFTTGVIATVQSNSEQNKLIQFSMTGESSIDSGRPVDEIPPEREAPATTVVCDWATLVNAQKVEPVP